MNFNYEPKIGKIDKVSTDVGMMSLIGVSKQRPCSWGNYFWLSQDNIRVWNFWAENLEAASYRFLNDGLVQIIKYKNGCIIFDSRIPEDWYYNKLCYTGHRPPEKEEAREIFNILGDPYNEYEFFEDKESYYKKRGAKYNPLSGIITYTLPSGTPIVGSFNLTGNN